MLKYHNIESLQLPKSEEIFFQPSSYNDYEGFNKYTIYAWWSIHGEIVSFINRHNTDPEINENNDLIKESLQSEVHDLIDLVIQTYDDRMTCIMIDNKKYGDVEFLIRFDWDEGDRSVGIWPGYNVSLILNNEKPVYRTFDYIEKSDEDDS